MRIKNIFKISPLRLVIFLFSFSILRHLHFWCTPRQAIPNLMSNCGTFSDWLWSSRSIYSIWESITSWHILIITILPIIIGNLILEYKRGEQGEMQQLNKKFVSNKVAYLLIALVILLIFISSFVGIS